MLAPTLWGTVVSHSRVIAALESSVGWVLPMSSILQVRKGRLRVVTGQQALSPVPLVCPVKSSEEG